MKFYFLLFLFTCSVLGQQKIQLSKDAQISILTCAPGTNELYSYFGHSALRVKDPKNNLDKVYNYGTFDFNTPNFYLKFCQGKLLYQVSGYHFKYFPYIYHKQNRWIQAQLLQLNSTQNQKVFDYLEWNVLPENKNYHYDFFYDNCATRIHEVLEKSLGKIDFDYSNFPQNQTHRDLIHSYLPKNSWAKFGIDLALGAVIDKQATLRQYLFLPDYILLAAQNSTLNTQKLVAHKNYILKNHHLQLAKTSFILSPLFVSICVLLLTTFFAFKKKNKLWFNSISFVYGLLGVVIFCLWFLTEHSTTKMNMNLFWANPLLLAHPFITNKTVKKVLSYIIVVGLFLFIGIAIIGFQKFNICFYLLSICLIPILTSQITKTNETCI